MSLGDAIQRKQKAVLGLTVFLMVGGLWAATTMPVSIFPEVTFHRIGIIARAGDLPVEQSLTAVTQPLEAALASVLGVEMVRSETTRGGVQIDLRFGWGEDMLRALQLAQAATEETRGSLPPETQIETRLLDTSAFPIVGVAVTSKDRSLPEISDFVLYEAAPQLRTIPGVYRVELSGAKIREYALTVNPVALEQHHLDLAAVEKAIRGSNVIAGAGRVRDGYQLVLSVVAGEGTRVASLLDVVVASDHGIPVTLGTIARIEAVVREDFTRAAANGETAVLIGVSRQPSGNSVTVSSGVKERIADLARHHPDMKLAIFYDQADLVHAAVASVRDSILIGIVLAVATIFVFIADLRATLVAATVIPATILITTIVMRALGMSFNLMTLGGIAAGIGLVLDDAIVVVENFHRHRSAGENSDVALSSSTSEIAAALVGSTLTPVAVLLPLSFLGEVPGAFFRPLAITMAVALLTSLVLALTFTPAMTAALDPESPRPQAHGLAARLTERLSHAFGRSLRWTLNHRWIAVALGGALLVLAWISYRQLETGFVPEMDEGAFILDYWAPPGTSLEETTQLLASVDEVLRSTPEVSAFSRRTGTELGFFLTQANRGDFSVRLISGRRRPIADVIADVRSALLARSPGLRIEFVQILQDMLGDLSGTPTPIEIKLFGIDQRVLEENARKVNKLISEVPGVVDNFDGITPDGPTYRVAIDEPQASRVGLSADVVQHWLETAVVGTIVGQVLEGDRAIPLRLRYPDEFRDRLDAIGNLTLVTPQGQLAPLRSIAHLDAGPPTVQRSRENLRQLVRVTARLEDRDLGSASAEIRQRLGRELSLPAGVTLEYGGLYASQQRAFWELVAVFCASAASVGALLLLEFGSFAAVFAIVIGSTLALSGSFATLWVTRTPLNVSSIVGMVMVLGIVAKNGILLLDFTSRAREASGDLESALIEAGRVRLRPILMTSLAAIAGLAPLALGIGAGSQMQQPLAIAILGGVSLSMLFSLIGVPLLFVLFSRGRGDLSG